jgi:hypothetical protein
MVRLWKSTSRPRKSSEIEIVAREMRIRKEVLEVKRGLANTSLVQLRRFFRKAPLPLSGYCMRASNNVKIGWKYPYSSFPSFLAYLSTVMLQLSRCGTPNRLLRPDVM